MEPGEDHELSETMHIMVPDSDSDWEETQTEPDTFLRQKRLPSFIRYKHMQVVVPTPSHSLSSIHDDSSTHSRRLSSLSTKFPLRRTSSPRYYQPIMKEKLVSKLSKGSVGSFSFSNELSSFLEQEEETYREMVVDSSSHLTVDENGHKRKVSGGSTGMLIKVEPEGKSVTLTRERLSSTSVDEGEEEGSGLEREYGLTMTLKSRSEEAIPVVKSKTHKRREKHHRNKCKVS